MRPKKRRDLCSNMAELVSQTGSRWFPFWQSDPEQFEQLKEDLCMVAAMQRATRASRLFALAEVVERRAHFSYSDSAEMLSATAILNVGAAPAAGAGGSRAYPRLRSAAQPCRS